MSDGSMRLNQHGGMCSTDHDAENEARALRVLEVMNDFRTLQVHITSLVTRNGAQPTKADDHYLDGYMVLRQCSAQAQAILATHYNPGNLGIGGVGAVPETEMQKATLQRYSLVVSVDSSWLTDGRIILDASTRRFQAHKIYLRAAAAMRWVQLREQALGISPDKREAALSAIDARLRRVCLNPGQGSS